MHYVVGDSPLSHMYVVGDSPLSHMDVVGDSPLSHMDVVGDSSTESSQSDTKLQILLLSMQPGKVSWQGDVTKLVGHSNAASCVCIRMLCIHTYMWQSQVGNKH